MKSKFNTFAPILALIFLALAGSAFKYGKQFEVRAKTAMTDEGVARTNMEVAEIALSEVQALEMGPAQVKMEKNAELAQGVASIMTLAVENGIKISNVGTTGSGPQGAKAIETIFTTVPLTAGKLHRADINVKGEYKSYEGFQAFFEQLRRRGVAVQSVNVRRSFFEATIRFMGN